jgi:hypothetical protein
MYQLIETRTEQKRETRIYKNTHTGTEVKTSVIYVTPDGVKFWGFNDLYKIPYIRTAFARHISDLYTIGLSLKDILSWCEQEKSLLKSEDPEKYEKLYALVLEKERLAKFTADPIRQQLALCTVYILTDEERIDYFEDSQAEQKLNMWMGSPEMIAFFLTWHTEHIRRYMKTLDKISTTVLKMEKQEREREQFLKP